MLADSKKVFKLINEYPGDVADLRTHCWMGSYQVPNSNEQQIEIVFNDSSYGEEVVDYLKLFFFVNGFTNRITYGFGGPIVGQKSRVIITASTPDVYDDSFQVYHDRYVNRFVEGETKEEAVISSNGHMILPEGK